MRKRIYRRNSLAESKIRRGRLTEGTSNFGKVNSGDMPSFTYVCVDWFADGMYDECGEAFVKDKSYSELGKLEDKYGSIYDSPEYTRFEEDFVSDYMMNFDVDRILFEDMQKDIEDMVDEANDNIQREFLKWVDKHYSEEDAEEFQYLDLTTRSRDVYTSGDFSPIVIEYGYYEGALLTALGEDIRSLGDASASANLAEIVKSYLESLISKLD